MYRGKRCSGGKCRGYIHMYRNKEIDITVEIDVLEAIGRCNGGNLNVTEDYKNDVAEESERIDMKMCVKPFSLEPAGCSSRQGERFIKLIPRSPGNLR
jgi:hypothetical protein